MVTLQRIAVGWNNKYPWDRRWRNKNGVGLFSQEHKGMCLVDILIAVIEDDMYLEAIMKYQKDKKKQEEGFVLDPSDIKYSRGVGNYLNSQEDTMTEIEKDDLFDKINI